MATITTNQFLDSAARTAGEAHTMNGAVLTVRTDTRWHANAPAGMLGSLGSTTISATLGGGVVLDGRNVRWMAYTGGSGNVPAIGTVVTQGGVSGYLLGVWSSLAAAPSAVASAMPATGFLKFREVTGGPYAAGALSGIGAIADSPDVRGWIEVVQDQAAANTVPRLGFFRVRGDWFGLGVTTGVAGQQVQVPTNGGGVGTRVPAIWIETAPGSDVYESFPAVVAAYFLVANLGTDARSKFVLMDAGGIVRIGGDGTSAIGYLPAAGCKIRIPNVLGRQCATGTRAANALPHATLASRPDFTTTSAGDIDFEYFANDWYHLFAAAYRVRMIHCATLDAHTSSNEASPMQLEDYVTGAYQVGGLLSLTNCALGGTIKDSKFFRADAASYGHCMSLTGVSNIELDNVTTGVIQYARSTGSAVLSQCRNVIITGCTVAAVTLSPATCANVEITDLIYIDRLIGTTNATTGKYAIVCTVSCDNVMCDGISFGGYANLHPYLGMYNASNCSNITFRNAGTPAAPIGGATNAPAYIFADLGNNDGVRVQRCALTATRIGLYTTVNTSKNIVVENCRGTVGAVATAANDTLSRGLRAASYLVTGQASVYGTHWFDMFTSDTVGRVWFALNEPTASSADQVELVTLGAGAGYTSGGQISMPNVGDQIIATMPYAAIGHTALANTAPILTGTNTGNFTYEYALDTGAGFGAYKLLTAANLSGETISPTAGFRLRMRITTATANAGNALTYIAVVTDTTLVAQQAALYPLDYAVVSLSGLEPGSRVQLFDLDADAELYNAVVAGTSLVYQVPYVSDFGCRVRVMYADDAAAKMWVEFTESVGLAGLTRTIVQNADTVYATNAVDGSAVTGITIDDGPMLVNVTAGLLSWADIYAYETFWLTTEEGIRDKARFITAVDPANYRLEGFQIRNTGAGPLVLVGGYGVDATTGAAIDVIDPSGGTIIASPDHVVAYATSGGAGPTAGSIAAAVRTTLRPDLAVINDGVRVASLLVPHTTTLSP